MHRFVSFSVLLISVFTSAHAAELPGGIGPNRGPTVDTRLQTRNTTPQPVDNLDSLLDYDLYFADPATATGWYIEWTYEDGVVLYSFAYSTEEQAFEVMVRHVLRGTDPRDAKRQGLSYPSVQIIELPKEPNWILFGTYDTQSAAAADAALLQSAGFLTKMKVRESLQNLMWQSGL